MKGAVDEKTYVDSRKTSEVYARETQWRLLITLEAHPAQGVPYWRQLSAWKGSEESITCLPCSYFSFVSDYNLFSSWFSLRVGLMPDPNTTSKASPGKGIRGKRKEKKAGRNQIITEDKWNKRRETPPKQREWKAQTGETVASTTPCRKAPPQSSAWRHDSTWNKNSSPSPSSSILLGLQLVTAWQGPRAERQGGPSIRAPDKMDPWSKTAWLLWCYHYRVTGEPSSRMKTSFH